MIYYIYTIFIGYQKILGLFQGSVIKVSTFSKSSSLVEQCFLGTTESPAHVALRLI